MDGKRALIAGVPCLILRIGFVGEVGYEIHYPSAHGEFLWDALMDAGKPHGLRPFGLEPQRLLRLQKMHVLIGQDTDSESTPFAAAMPWIVKLDKEDDFIGKWALKHYAEIEPETALVGFTMANGHVPTEGAVVVRSGVAAGQVTSSRYSPQLDKVIGLAWVPKDLAADDAAITISDEGDDLRRRRADEAVLRPRGGGAALVSLEFLAPDAAVATTATRRSHARRWSAPPGPPVPASRSATAGTSRSATRSPEREREACRETAGWADVSHLGKLELHATSPDDLAAIVAAAADGATLELGTATRAADAWWLPLTAGRAVVVCDPAALAGPARAPRGGGVGRVGARSASSTRRASTRR